MDNPTREAPPPSDPTTLDAAAPRCAGVPRPATAYTAKALQARFNISQRQAQRWINTAEKRGVEAGEYPVVVVSVVAGKGARAAARALLIPDDDVPRVGG